MFHMAAQTFMRLTISQIACRLLVSKPVEPATKEKISMFCHVATEQVIGVHDLVSVYHVPLLLQSQGLVPYLQKRLDLSSVNITSAMTDKGLALEKKWREVTEYALLFLASNSF
jgi:CTP synthase